MNSEERIAQIKMDRYFKPQKRMYTLMEILDLAQSWKKANLSNYNVELLDDFLKFMKECENG